MACSNLEELREEEEKKSARTSILEANDDEEKTSLLLLLLLHFVFCFQPLNFEHVSRQHLAIKKAPFPV